jgi:SAM-dependent methyltransferase
MYDRLMRHVEYDEWAALIRRVIGRFGESGSPDILEIGAGTGVVGERLSGFGYRYVASDLSFPMCREARARGLPTCAADARRLPFKKQFGMALFLYDGINYLFTANDYRKLFSSVYDALVPGGLFLFDITTRWNSVTHFSNYLDFEDYGDFCYARHSYFDAAESVQHNDFTIYRLVDDGADSSVSGDDYPLTNSRTDCGDGTMPTDASDENHPPLYEKFTEAHEQKVFSVSEIEKTIPKKRFTVLGVWDGYTFRKYSSRSERVHFLLRKNGGA